MEAVLLSYREYEYLKNLEEIFERYEIKNMINDRFKKYNTDANISWDKLKEKE